MDRQLIDHTIRDARYGLRLLQRSPIFTAVAILSLGLGIGANAAIFHLIDAIHLRALPVAAPETLVEVRPGGPQAFGTYDGVNAKATAPLWELIRTNQSAFSTMFAWGDAEFVVGRGADSRRARGLWVSGDFFGALGIVPARGRLLGPADDRSGCEAAAVISHGFWRSTFGGSDAAVGSVLTVLDRPVTVVGIAPASFTGLEVGQNFDVVLPLCSTALWDGRLQRRDRWWLTIMGRLKPGWTVARANEHLRALSPGVLDAAIPPGYDASLVAGYRGLRFGAVPAGRGVSRLRDEHARSLVLLLALTGLVLLMTCGNLGTLMLARAGTREREVAVRAAVGASRGRLLSQLLIESLLVAAGGALMALPVALFSARALIALLATATAPITLELDGGWRLMAFVAATATLTTILFGLLPALRVSLADPNAAMHHRTRGSTVDRGRARLQRGLVVAQIALSLMLVFSALLFVQTFRNLAAVATGFEPEGALAISFMDRASDALPPERKIAFQDQLTREIRSVPGVAAAVSSTHVPLSGATWSHFFRVTGVTGERKASRFAYVGPGYFEMLGIPIHAGRGFQDLDNTRSRRVMVVNQSFVRSHLDGVDPIGASVRTLEEPGFPAATYEVIGVVGDTKYADLRDENCWCPNAGETMAPIAYVPIAQNPSPYAWAPVIVRSLAPGAAIASAIAQRVERLAPGVSMHFSDLQARVRERVVNERLVAWLAGAFAILAMALVVVGLYGIVAYLATARRGELGIRLALGATRGQIVTLLLRDNLWMMAVGIAIGVPLAVGAMRAARALLYGLSPTDGVMVTGAACVLAAAGALAATVPAWRAARVPLADAIRPE